MKALNNTASVDSNVSVRFWKAHKGRIRRWTAVVIAFALWQLSSLFLNPILISTPSAVVVSIVHLISNGQLPTAFLQSLLEMIAGLVIALVIGIGVGILMGRVKLLERALAPLVSFGNATPSLALLPVMEVWFGFGSYARIAFIMVICMWPMLVNTYVGMRSVKRSYTDVGKAFGLRGWKQTWKVYVPGTTPFLFSGLRIALAVGAVGMILGGSEVGQSGLGGLTVIFGTYSQTANLVATIVTTTVLALILFSVAKTVQNRRFPWIADTSAGRRAS